MIQKNGRTIFNNAALVSPVITGGSATDLDIDNIVGVISHSATLTETSATVPWAMLYDTDEYLNGITKGKTATVTMTIENPCVVTWAGHGLHADSEVVFTSTGDLPTGITAGVRYYVIATDLTENTFKISATPQGAAIETTGTQSGTHTGTNTSIINIVTAGVYGFIFSTLCDVTNSSGNGSTIDIWFRKNGVDVDRSNTRAQVATTGNVIPSVADVVIDCEAGDEIEMFWVGSTTYAQLLAVAAQVSPTRPATPSTILTIKKLSTGA